MGILGKWRVSRSYRNGTEIQGLVISNLQAFLSIQSTYIIFQQSHSRRSELDSKATLPRRQFRGTSDVNEHFIAIISTKHHFARDNHAPLVGTGSPMS